MILFLIFASCSLIIIAAGASTYSRISDDFHSTFSSSAAVRYVTNKIRSGERVSIEDGGNGLAVYNGEAVCVIMTTDRGIAERNMRADTYIDFTGGDVIFPDAKVDISEYKEGIWSVTVTAGGDSFTAYCRSKE